MFPILLIFNEIPFSSFPPRLLYFTRISPLLHADALRYIREGIGVAHADYPHQSRQAFLSTVQGIRIFTLRAKCI